MNLGKLITENLFGKPDQLTSAHRFYFKLFELYIVYETINLAWEWGLYTLKISDVVLPLGIANLIDISFMHDNYLPIINAIAISILLVLSFFRKGSKWQYAVVFVLLHFQYVARFSIGEIPHSANLVGMAIFSFAVGLAAFQNELHRYRFIIGFTIFYIGLGYFSASISKLIGTGPNWIDGRHLWLWIAEKSTDILSREGQFNYNFVQITALKSIPAATFMLFIGIATEFFGILIWFRKLRPYVALALIGMHFGVMMSMNIRFDSFMIELIILGFPFPELYLKYGDQIKSYFSGREISI
jgi:hypothetical protein